MVRVNPGTSIDRKCDSGVTRRRRAFEVRGACVGAIDTANHTLSVVSKHPSKAYKRFLINVQVHSPDPRLSGPPGLAQLALTAKSDAAIGVNPSQDTCTCTRFAKVVAIEPFSRAPLKNGFSEGPEQEASEAD
jgi:hypothetical protein